MKIKKLAFVGNFRLQHCSEMDYFWTFRQMGIEVVQLQEGMTSGEAIEAAALDCDALFWVHTHGWKPQGKSMREVLLTLKLNGVPSFGYHLDLWKGIARETDLQHDDYWLVDDFFTVDKLMADWLNTQPDKPRGHFLQAGVVERDCYLGAKVDRDFPEVVFVGSRNYHPEWPYRPMLIDWLKATYGSRFQHYGGDGAGVVRGDTLNRLYANSKIVVGDTLCKGFNYPYYTSDRVYETTGRGGFLIHPYITGMETEFVDGKEIIFYDYADFKGLKQLIDYYLEHDYQREAIRRAGYKRTKAQHTYTNRLSHILATVELLHSTNG